MEKCNVLGIEYNNVTTDIAAKEIYELALKGRGGYVVTPNAEIGESCFKDLELQKAVESADYILPDGAGVVLASKICGEPLSSRAAGFDVSKKLISLMARDGKRLYLLGAKPGTAEEAAKKITEKYPGIVIAGMHHGYFKDDNEVVAEINAAKPDALFVALGSPRQELFMYNYREKINALMLGIGGSLDVYAGFVKRAPEFFIKLNLEWFYRLIKQPWRVGRMMRLPKYILRAAAWRIKN